VSARLLPPATALCAALLLAGAAPAQEGPIRLFPQDLGPTAPDRPGSPTAPPRPGAPEASAPEGFQVEGLAPPEVDSIGLAGTGAGGFEPALWADSSPRVVLSLVSQLPVAVRNPALQALTRRLLVTGATLDGASAESGRMLGARVERLLAMGDLDSAKRLLDQLPPSVTDPGLARLGAEVGLLTGDDAAACQRAAELAPTSSAAFWSEVAIYCRLASGDSAGASLGLDLLRDVGRGGDAAFVRLATMLADGGDDAAPPALAEPAPIHIGLLRLARQPVPEAALERAPPAVLTAIARDPVLAGARQLEIAERAFAAGGLPPSDLAAIYLERPLEGDALERIRSDWGPQARALALQAGRERQAPQQQAALLDAVWRAAAGDERFLVAAVFASQFGELQPDRALLPVAASAAQALLAAGRALPAARWFSLLSSESARDGDAARELAALVPLFALAGIGGSDAVPELDQRAIGAWRAVRPDADAARLFALLDGVGSPVPDAAWWQQLEAPLERPASVPVAALWRGLERAAAGGRRGETVLFALHMMNGAPEAVHPEVLSAALQALRAVGLDREARDIAVATAVGMDL
jgi:hypothetical protein